MWILDGHFEEWYNSQEKRKFSQCSTDHNLRLRSNESQHEAVRLGDISQVQEAVLQLYRRLKPLPHTSTQRPGMTLHVTSLQALPHTSTVSDKPWGEKTSVPMVPAGCPWCQLGTHGASWVSMVPTVPRVPMVSMSVHEYPWCPRDPWYL